MPLDALAPSAARPAAPSFRLLRLALALLSVALVAGIAVLLARLLAGSAPPVPRGPHPFGMGIGESGPRATSALGAWLLSWQAEFFNALRAALAALRDGRGGAPLLIGIGFAYGVFHAAGPGHGKAVVSAYIVSSERALMRGIAVSALAALIQALVAIALVTVVFLVIGGTAATMSRTVGQVETAGFALVVLLGALLVWRKAGALALLAGGRDPREAAALDPTCSCGPVDPRRAGGSPSQMLAVAFGAGIRPCAGAIIVLTLSRAYGIFAMGVAATFAMALGTAITTSALAAFSVYAKRLALRYAAGRGRGTALLGAGAELLAAALVLVVGLALLAGMWDAAGGA